MTCVKTGCHIWLVPYQEFAYGDAFRLEPVLRCNSHIWQKLRQQDLANLIQDFYCFRLVSRNKAPINGRDTVDFVVYDWDQWFGQPEFNSQCRGPASTLISNNTLKGPFPVTDFQI